MKLLFILFSLYLPYSYGIDQADLDFLNEFDDLTEEEIEKERVKQEQTPKAIIELSDFDDVELDPVTLEAPKAKEDNKIDFELLDEISKYNIDKVTNLISTIKKSNRAQYTISQLKALEVQLKDIINSPTRLYHIPRKTELYRISDGQKVYTTRSLTVRAHTLLDFNKDRYITSHKSELIYKVPFQKITNIKDITDLNRKPHQFKRVSKKVQRYKTLDERYPLSFSMNLHGGISVPSYTKDLVDAKNNTDPLFRTEFILSSMKDHLFNIGFAAQYEIITGNLIDDGSYQYSSLALGPSFKVNNFLGPVSFYFRPKVSVLSELSVSKSDGVDVLKLSESSIQMALDFDYTYRKDVSLVFGVSAQRKWISASTQNANYSISPTTNTDDSVTLYVGHRTDWL